MAKNDTILMLGLLGIGAYVVFKSDIAGGVGEAVGGLGEGIGTAGEGLGQGISDLNGQITSVTGDVAELTSFVGEFGNWTAQQFTELQQNSLREQSQKEVVDIGAFDESKQRLIDIQVEKDLIAARENAERNRLIEEEKTQFVERATNIDTWIIKAGQTAWKYNPLGLLTSYITGQSSPEEAAAPLDSAPQVSTASITGGVVQGSSVRNVSVSTGSRQRGGLFSPSAPTARPSTISGTFQGLPVSVPVSQPSAPTTISKIGGFLKRFIFI